jgi:hypothetical protein
MGSLLNPYKPLVSSWNMKLVRVGLDSRIPLIPACEVFYTFDQRGHEMFTLYIDDGGTDPKQPVAIATALKIPARQLMPLQREWDTFRKKEGFACFHTAEFMARNPKSEFADWNEAKQERIFKRVRQISKKYGVRALSVAVNKKDYDELMPDEYRPYFGKYHYTWAIRQLVSFVGRWYEVGAETPFEFVFQWMGSPRDEKPSVVTQNRPMRIT